jgi:hypothetical protein
MKIIFDARQIERLQSRLSRNKTEEFSRIVSEELPSLSPEFVRRIVIACEMWTNIGLSVREIEVRQNKILGRFNHNGILLEVNLRVPEGSFVGLPSCG